MKKLIINSEKYGIKEVLLDDEDYIFVLKFKWYVANKDGVFYVQRSIRKGNKVETEALHRVIMKTPKHSVCDHVDHDTLNNQKYNLRNCLSIENMRNRNPIKGCSSKYIGVSVHKSVSRNREKIYKIYFKSSIRYNGKAIHIGIFPYTDEGEVLAAKAYDEYAKKYFFEFANLNFK